MMMMMMMMMMMTRRRRRRRRRRRGVPDSDVHLPTLLELHTQRNNDINR